MGFNRENMENKKGNPFLKGFPFCLTSMCIV